MIVLYGKSSMEWWMHCSPLDQSGVGSVRLPEKPPSRDEVEDLLRNTPFLSKPVHYLVCCKEGRVISEDVRGHASSRKFKKGAFIRLYGDVFASSPELSYIEAASQISELQAIEYGSLLCASFAMAPGTSRGTKPRGPIASRESLGCFLRDNSGLRGICRARSCLPYLTENAASPAEINLGMKLFLPSRLGGFGLMRPVHNKRLKVGKKGKAMAQREFLVSDLCWPSEKLVVEYDSDQEHLASRQITKDATKRSALLMYGYQVITVTSRQLSDPVALERVAKLIASLTGSRVRPRASRFEQMQRNLYRGQDSLWGTCGIWF